MFIETYFLYFNQKVQNWRLDVSNMNYCTYARHITPCYDAFVMQLFSRTWPKYRQMYPNIMQDRFGYVLRPDMYCRNIHQLAQNPDTYFYIYLKYPACYKYKFTGSYILCKESFIKCSLWSIFMYRNRVWTSSVRDTVCGAS